MNGQGALPFSEEEMFRAMRLMLPEDEARAFAQEWAALPGALERGEVIGWNLADGTYLVLSLLGGETAQRVETKYVAHLPAEERAQFERQREELRRQLEDEGKL